jgi:membrane protease YdiL (CAAX protease family)
MKNWQPVTHFGLKVLATYFLGFIAMVIGLIITTYHWHVTVNASNNVMMLCFAVTLLALSHWWLHLPLFKRPQHIPIASIFVVVMMAFNLIGNDLHWQLLPTALVNALCIGIFEELAARGPILFWLWTKTPRRWSPEWWTAITSGLCFGLIHLNNYSVNPDWTQILIQVGYAAVMGFAAAGLFMYTHNLSFTILMHAGVDTLAGLNNASMISHVSLNWQDLSILLCMVIVDLAIGIWLMKQLTRKPHDLQF